MKTECISLAAVLTMALLLPPSSFGQVKQKPVTITYPEGQSGDTFSTQQSGRYGGSGSQRSSGAGAQMQQIYQGGSGNGNNSDLQARYQRNLKQQSDEAYKNNAFTPRMKQLKAEEKVLEAALYGSPKSASGSVSPYGKSNSAPGSGSNYNGLSPQLNPPPGSQNTLGNPQPNSTQWQQYQKIPGTQTYKQYMNSGQYWRDRNAPNGK